MKQKLILFFAVTLFSTIAFAQKSTSSNKKAQLVGIHFNLLDFKSPNGIKDPLTGKVYSSVKEMSKGFGLSYWRGLTNKIDLSVKANANFHDYASIFRGVTGKTEIGIELEPTLNIRPYGDNNLIAPFLTVGVGGGLYNDEFGGYLPVGLGIQLNFNKEAYLFTQAQYRFSLTKSVVPDHLFYSFGIAQSIGK
jgi:OmpA-OmpF porin, OOP family